MLRWLPGYGVLFTIAADYRDEYDISENWIGIIIGIGFIAGFLSQITIAPLADRGHARKLVLGGVFVNVLGLVLMALGASLVPILIGRFISGLGIGAATPSIKRIVVLADPANLGQNMGTPTGRRRIRLRDWARRSLLSSLARSVFRRRFWPSLRSLLYYFR